MEKFIHQEQQPWWQWQRLTQQQQSSKPSWWVWALEQRGNVPEIIVFLATTYCDDWAQKICQAAFASYQATHR